MNSKWTLLLGLLSWAAQTSAQDSLGAQTPKVPAQSVESPVKAIAEAKDSLMNHQPESQVETVIPKKVKPVVNEKPQPVLEEKVAVKKEPSDSLPVKEPEQVERQKWGILPAYAYRKETGHQLGALVIYYLPQIENSKKPSNITTAALYSTQNQARFVVAPSVYFGQDRKHWSSSLDFKIWPSQFYGIGEDPQFEKGEISPKKGEAEDPDLAGILYHNNLFSFTNLYEVSTNGKFWYGVENRFHTHNIAWTRQGLLEGNGFGQMDGYDGGITSGLGAVASYDTRDNINSAHTGALVKWTSRIYGQFLGSDYEYNEHKLDARVYLPIPGGRTLAMRTYHWGQFGDVPFYMLASTDGKSELRGVPIGYYQDKQLSSYQMEFRSAPLPWRLGYRVFGDLSQVRPDINQFHDAKYHYTYGVGLRWALNPERRFNVRIELPIVDGQLSPVVEIKEAF